MSSRPGDWNCRTCQHLNFQRRDTCQRCGESKYGGGRLLAGGSGSSSFVAGSDVRPGDWYCTVGNCGAHNFASRSSCFKCGAYRDLFDHHYHSGNGGFDHVDISNIARSRGLFGMTSAGSGGGGSGSSNRSAWKSGDWICTRWGCNEHNFASRMECFKCNAPRDFSTRTSY